MLRNNVIISVVLAAVAALLWADVSYMFRYGLHSPSYPTIMAAAFTACNCLGWVLVMYAYRRGDNETRCRKCKYILKGLSEPRCPECGEPAPRAADATSAFLRADTNDASYTLSICTVPMPELPT